MKKWSFLVILVSSTLSAQTINFSLKAQVFDDGQKITALELETKHLKFNRQNLTPDIFEVYVKSNLPIDPQNNNVFGQSEGKQSMNSVSVKNNGNIELRFSDNSQANTLAYIDGQISRNVEQQLDYQINLKQVGIFTQIPQFKQTDIMDNEVERFTPKISKSGLNYQIFSPNLQNSAQKRPLIIWFHGNGEGGVSSYQNNRAQLLANRGAIAFAETNTQKIFGGAYVIAPQAPDTWYHNYSKNYIQKMKGLIDEIVANNAIDNQRIYLFGASAGGYMALRMYIEYPELFAAASIAAPALDKAPLSGGKATTEADLEKIKHKPLWLVHSANDPTISYTNTSKRVFQFLRESGAILTAYPTVQIGKKDYNGHWSWIYSARNLPVNPQGDHLFQWVAKQRLTQ
ncbi:phospholipase [[Actinobacillus] muris]|uniref:Phospholipase n=1 Tax=Muribacter muris TaxID=67855 RepID=A0A0J5P882_9PAST|nr:prolyl oligopeptidase family serine peptidase [Muribacter muris]KMK51704.1 phospholipase [[Actinobacillus] muris] [Muribacter muris]